ncbi:microsomal triglyceride transfer protein large subunit [Sitophilus oryzae]|uniref:Microsomal triglyceride transfer protein large subunit n=1 Tax=Sitophilus oryzae TaxID=7048 RepID=A0A6J2Y094_SITOR|nr:microsomal triglyceride transfer protein large subunit [Sitophilus oryzae]
MGNSGIINLYSVLYMTFFTLCSGFVLISSASAPVNRLELFSLGESLVYQWKSTVLLNEIDQSSKNVGFAVAGKVTVDSVWAKGDLKLLKVEWDNPKLHVTSKETPETDKFVSRSSNLDKLSNKPFLVLWNNGQINKVYFPKDEPLSLKNLKKGIAGQFQLSPSSEESTQVDPSGHCSVTYSSNTPNKILKTIQNCSLPNHNNQRHTNFLLGTTTKSIRTTDYTVDDPGKKLNSIIVKEFHTVVINAKEDFGSTVNSEIVCTLEETKQVKTLSSKNVEEAVNELSVSDNILFLEDDLYIKDDDSVQETVKKFHKEVDIQRENLSNKHLGTAKSSKAFLQLLQVAKVSTLEDIGKTLNSKKNKNILSQLYDVLGYTQTENSHKAVLKKLHLDNEEHGDFIERYLWALSFSNNPNVDIVKDLLNKYNKYTNIPDKIKNTLILSLASMARTLASSKLNDYETLKVLKSVEETIVNGLEYAKDEDRFVFLNALKNLQSPSTIPTLTKYLKKGTLKEETLAWRAIKSFPREFWPEDLLKQAKQTLFQLDKRHDTSSRTLAADVILETDQNEATLEELLHFVAGNETNYEIKQYVFQSINMLSEKDVWFNNKVQNIIRRKKVLNNYSSLSPRGLSTALARDMFKGVSANGSLVSVQEIKSGIVKRGVVNVILEKDNVPKELFTLGIFSGGLNSFMSSEDGDEQDPNESATAGMELTVLGTQIRPFVFFDGQGELMGHVWSGTASDMTPAFQALILWQDHEDRITLSNGFVAVANFKGAVSFDLSGKISISLWNRNAQSIIEKSIGLVNRGEIGISTSFVKSKVEFEASVEPKLSLEIDADFSSNVKLCMRLSQPHSLLSYFTSKLESIPNTKHQIKFSRTRKREIPGVTYALNRKNSEMCNAIF